MGQTKYASAVSKDLGLGLNFRPCSEGYFFFGRPQSVDYRIIDKSFLVIFFCPFFEEFFHFSGQVCSG